MNERLETQRLALRPIVKDDAGSVVALLNDFEVVKNLAPIPYPYEMADALKYLASFKKRRSMREAFDFAILRKDDGVLMGALGVEFGRGAFQLAYWLGRPFWGQGYASEAGRAGVDFAFKELPINLLASGWFFDNPASGKVLAKLGFRANGSEMRKSLSRGVPVLCHNVVLTREEYERRKALQ